MKKLIFFLLALLTTTSLICCAPQSTSDEYTDSYLYTQIKGVLYKISTVSASVTPMCPDPLCFHSDESCSFYGIDSTSIKMSGKYMYYLKDDKAFEYYTKLCRFDMQSGKYEVLYAPENGTLAELFVTDEYLYFNIGHFDDERNYLFNVCRYDLKAKKAEYLTSEPQSQIQCAYRVIDDRIYWQEDIDFDTLYYSTNLEYGERIEQDTPTPEAHSTMGDFSFRLDNTGFDSDTYSYLFSLTRIDTVSGEEKVIFEELGCFPILYGGKIIYSKLDEPKFLGYVIDEETGLKKATYDKWGGKYYICDSDGSNERLLCDLDGTGCAIPITPNIIGGSGVDDWIAINAYHYTDPDENGIIERDSNVYLLINIVTGEVKVAQIERRS